MKMGDFSVIDSEFNNIRERYPAVNKKQTSEESFERIAPPAPSE